MLLFLIKLAVMVWLIWSLYISSKFSAEELKKAMCTLSEDADCVGKDRAESAEYQFKTLILLGGAYLICRLKQTIKGFIHCNINDVLTKLYGKREKEYGCKDAFTESHLESEMDYDEEPEMAAK